MTLKLLYAPLFLSRVQPRKDCREVQMKGAFPGADVVRGVDWNHKDEDGKQFIPWDDF